MFSYHVPPISSTGGGRGGGGEARTTYVRPPHNTRQRRAIHRVVGGCTASPTTTTTTTRVAAIIARPTASQNVLRFAFVVCSLSVLCSHWAVRVLEKHQQTVLFLESHEVGAKKGELSTTLSSNDILRLHQMKNAQDSTTSSFPPPNSISSAESGSRQSTPDKDEDEPFAAFVWNQKSVKTKNNPFPIINVGLPKSGEDTIWNFFHNLGYVAQYGCGDLRRPRPKCLSLGSCIHTNAMNKMPAFSNCSTQLAAVDPSEPEFQVYTRLDEERYLSHLKPVKRGQYLPQIMYLEEIYRYAPNATWLLPLHLPDHWAYTFSRQNMLRKRLWNEVLVTKYNSSVPVRNRKIFEPEPLEMEAVDHWTLYYNQHTKRIQDFVRAHPTIRLIELQYRLKRAPIDLVDSLGLPVPSQERPNARIEDLWKCMSDECDLWTENLERLEHHKVTPRPQLKLPKPIFVVGLPKSGTTSVSNFFSCGGALSQHYCCCGDVADHRPCYSKIMADCILENKKNGRPMLENCGEYDLYAQLDGEQIYITNSSKGKHGKQPGHFLPQVFELDWIHREYPNATFILPLRDSYAWSASVSRWFNMRHRIRSEFIHMNRSSDIEGVRDPLVAIYNKHTERIVRFVERHPSHKLVMFHISDQDAGRVLARESGLPESCWGHHNINKERKY